jgi:hypothetical protein
MICLAVDLPPLGLRRGEDNFLYNFLRYAVTCWNAATKLSISLFFPIVTRM